MNDKKFTSRLNRYLKGTSDQEEKQLVDEWYDSFPVDTDIAPLNIEEKEIYLFAGITTKIEQGKRSRFRIHYGQLLKVAALLLMISSIAFLWHTSVIKDQQYKAQFIVINTSATSLKKITLPDSSVVWLNTSGKIRYQNSFADTNRVVYLDEGEAFFEVTKNPKKPFYVYTPTLHTRVLGTSFNIKSYKSLNLVRVTVSTGKVQVGDSKQSFGLFTAGQQLTYSVLNGKGERGEYEGMPVAAWRTGTIRLLQVNFNELAFAVNSLYHVNLKVADPALQNLKYTLTLDNKQSLTDALMIINAIHETKIRRTNNEITLYK